MQVGVGRWLNYPTKVSDQIASRRDQVVEFVCPKRHVNIGGIADRWTSSPVPSRPADQSAWRCPSWRRCRWLPARWPGRGWVRQRPCYRRRRGAGRLPGRALPGRSLERAAKSTDGWALWLSSGRPGCCARVAETRNYPHPVRLLASTDLAEADLGVQYLGR